MVAGGIFFLVKPVVLGGTAHDVTYVNHVADQSTGEGREGGDTDCVRVAWLFRLCNRCTFPYVRMHDGGGAEDD